MAARDRFPRCAAFGFWGAEVNSGDAGVASANVVCTALLCGPKMFSTYSLRFPISCRLGQRHGLQNITLTNVFC
jgi:hypothetical protein